MKPGGESRFLASGERINMVAPTLVPERPPSRLISSMRPPAQPADALEQTRRLVATPEGQAALARWEERRRPRPRPGLGLSLRRGSAGRDQRSDEKWPGTLPG